MQKTYLAYNRMGHRYMRGAGAPVGTPSRAGLRYMDTTTGLIYLSRNVLNFNGSSIAIPTITGVRKINLQFWHNDPAPASARFLYFKSGVPADQIAMSRAVTTGFLTRSGSASTSIMLDGVSISSDTTNPSASAWHTLSDLRSVDSQIDSISRSGSAWLGILANFQILGASDVLLASYAINEGTGTTIIDSSGNGRNGTLTLGSGNWELSWVPL